VAIASLCSFTKRSFDFRLRTLSESVSNLRLRYSAASPSIGSPTLTIVANARFTASKSRAVGDKPLHVINDLVPRQEMVDFGGRSG